MLPVSRLYQSFSKKTAGNTIIQTGNSYHNTSTDLDGSDSNSISILQPGISNPKVRDLVERYTTVDFTAYESGQVEACLTSESASKKNMLRFGIDIVEVEVLEDDSLTKEQENLHHELGQLEHMLIKFRMDMHSIQMEADYGKEREEDFFKEMMSMHQESSWWPILHVMVLFGAGFMQAQHIVSFFKKKHLI